MAVTKEEVVEFISNMTVLELAEFIKELEEKFGVSAAMDTLPKRLTHVQQDPNDPTTKVPLEKMKKTYYRARGWKDGIPTWHRLKTLGIKIDRSVYDAAVKEAYR